MIQLILFISPDAGEKGLLLEKIVIDGLLGFRSKVCRTLHELEKILRQPVSSIHERVIYVLFADTRNRLEALVNLAEAFDDQEILIVLPDTDSETFSIGARLRPRFAISKDQRFEELRSVLQKMSGASADASLLRCAARHSSHRKG